MPNSIDGFRIYKRVDGEYVEFATTDSMARAYTLLRGMDAADYALTAYLGTHESIKVPFSVNPFDKINLTKTGETNISVTFEWEYPHPQYTNGYTVVETTGDSPTGEMLTHNTVTIDKDVANRDIVISPITHDGYHAADSETERIDTVIVPNVITYLMEQSDGIKGNKIHIELTPYANTLIFRFYDNEYDPSNDSRMPTYGTWSKVSTSDYNDWMWGTDSHDLADAFRGIEYEFSIMAGNLYNVSNMQYMFAVCAGLQTVNISNIKSHAVISMSNIFAQCYSLTNVYELDTSCAVTLSSAFRGCNQLVNVPSLDCGNANDLSRMFESCESLSKVPHIIYEATNTQQVSIYSMFFNCTSLTDISMPYRFIPEYVLDCDNIFDGCVNISSGIYECYSRLVRTYPPPPFHDDAFRNCGNNQIDAIGELMQVPADWGGIGDVQPIDRNYLRVAFMLNNPNYDFDFDTWVADARTHDGILEFDNDDGSGIYERECPITVNVIKRTDAYVFCDITSTGCAWGSAEYAGHGYQSSMFYDTPLYRVFDGRLFEAGCDCTGLFNSCGLLTKVVMRVDNDEIGASYMFAWCPSLVDVSGLSIGGNIYYAYSMFQDCRKLVRIPPQLFDSHLELCITTNSMFDNCIALTPEGMRPLIMNRVRDISCMFRSCESISYIPEINMAMSSVPVDLGELCHGCSSLEAIPHIEIPSHNPNLITNMYKMFHSCYYVESGMVWFYNTVKDSPASHDGIFRYCGEETEGGRRERAQLPSDWL